ncbi:unnamed protein product [[Candida] boidinii]|nr:unnamed protein product [[Candida] boidinii]
MTQSKVLVTGANGFIATHVIDRLLANGYEVVGTGRNEEKLSYLLNLFKKRYPEGKLQFEKTSDISKLDAFDDALKNHPDIKYVAHIASPVTPDTKDFDAQKDFIIPAVNGVLGLFNGIKKLHGVIFLQRWSLMIYHNLDMPILKKLLKKPHGILLKMKNQISN